jgi:hypothetical protein
LGRGAIVDGLSTSAREAVVDGQSTSVRVPIVGGLSANARVDIMIECQAADMPTYGNELTINIKDNITRLVRR